MKPVPTHFGKFNDKSYKDFEEGGIKTGVYMTLEFNARNNVDATKIGLVQSVRSYLGGVNKIIHPTQEFRTVNKGEGEGYRVDRIPSRNNPIYGSPSLGPGLGLDKTAYSGGNYQLGYHYTDKSGLHEKEAWLKDSPNIPHRGNDSGQIFETTALAIDGAQRNTYYGSVQWGWTVDGSGNFNRLPLSKISDGVPSQNFMAPAEKWNTATTLGTIKTIADPTNVYDNSFSVAFTVPIGTEVIIYGGFTSHHNEVYRRVRVGTPVKTGLMKVSDMKDQGDGDATVDLPIVDVYYTNTPLVWLVTNPSQYRTTRTHKLPENTRVSITDRGVDRRFNNCTDRYKWWAVRIVDGPLTNTTGWVMQRFLTDENP
jgi:hypothetical protein